MLSDGEDEGTATCKMVPKPKYSDAWYDPIKARKSRERMNNTFSVENPLKQRMRVAMEIVFEFFLYLLRS